MKHITMTEKSLLVGDEVADLLLAYAALLAQHDSADTVNVHAYGADGDPVEVTFLLNSGASLMAETSDSPVEEPNNVEAIDYMRDRMRLLEHPPNAAPVEEAPMVQEWEF